MENVNPDHNRDLENYEKFKKENPHLFLTSGQDLKKQAQLMRKMQTSDYKLLSRKDIKMPQKLQSGYTSGGKSNHDAIQHARKYWARVRQLPLKSKPLTYVWAINMIESAIKSDMQRFGRNYSFDAYNKKVIQNLVRYFLGDESGKYDPNKGIWVYGVLGSGKTYIMDLFSRFSKKFNLRNKFSIVSCETLVDKVKTDGDLDSLKKYKKKTWCFDDIGEEDVVQLYSNREDVLSKLIKQCYRDWCDHGRVMLATSNLCPSKIVDRINQVEGMKDKLSSIESRYDERTCDRINQMFTFVPLLGENKRRL